MADANDNFTGFENKSYEENIVFIKNTLSQQGIPANFVPLQHTNAEKVFFRENGERFEWILFENGKFFCAYCLCFSSNRRGQFIAGYEYSVGSRCRATFNQHEKGKNHIIAKNIYVGKPESGNERSYKRIALDSIVKIIIFQASHGTYLMLSINHRKIRIFRM